jgi:hypothetical protein
MVVGSITRAYTPSNAAIIQTYAKYALNYAQNYARNSNPATNTGTTPNTTSHWIPRIPNGQPIQTMTIIQKNFYPTISR